MQPLRLLMLSVFTGLGVLLLSFTAWMVVDNIGVMRTHQHARAEVVKSQRIGSGARKGLTFYAVVVRYDGPRGRRTAQVDRSTSHYEPGEILSVYYRPETAYKVVAGSFMAMWFFPTILGTLGLVAVFFGLRPKDLRRPATPT
ncbi:MAG: DUF3592 domain-containing protein [Alphaproteobacteria bacterium]|nr:DUF3592 domain-containing protein [Alphaproteobacteria bacterium]MCW5742527.1 DUF3592 domain-containing protein [Alphaproteobacteria bacterium]